MSTSVGRCPNSSASCGCWEHAAGLSAYCPPETRDAYNAVLSAVRERKTRGANSSYRLVAIDADPCHGYANGCMCPDCYLRAETHSEQQPKRRNPGECDGTMTCRCGRCLHARKLRVQHGASEVSQPWTPRPARRAA